MSISSIALKSDVKEQSILWELDAIRATNEESMKHENSSFALGSTERKTDHHEAPLLWRKKRQSTELADNRKINGHKMAKKTDRGSQRKSHRGARHCHQRLE